MATHPQSTAPHSTGNTSVKKGASATATHVEQLVLCSFSRPNLLLRNSLHFQHLMKTKG
jgi:hypothetical protein